MICKKCGKEFDGNFCPNCGWKVKAKEPRKKLTKKQIMAIVIPIVVVAVLIAIIVPSAVVSSNIFRVGKVDKINIGDTQEQVIKILGEPYEKTDYKFEYYSDDYLKLAKQIDDYYNSDLDIDEDFDLDKDIDDFDPDKDLNWDDEDKITKMEEQLETMVYKYIEVEFDSEGKVKSVFFDAEKCDSKEYKKVVSSYKITTNKVKQGEPTDICYSAKFTDKSFYKGLAIKDFVWIYSTDKGTVQWSDQWKSDYEAEIKIEKDPNIIYAKKVDTGGGNAWYELRTNGELTILGSGEILGSPKSETIFEEPEKITNVIFEKDSKITRLGDYLFRECKNLTSIEIPSSVTSIDGGVFSNCSSLSSVAFGDNSQLTSIGSFAFLGCSSLTSIEIPNSVTSIGEDVFSGCSSLESITVDINNAKYKSDGNCIIEKETNTLIIGCKNSIIPNYVTSIGEKAFYSCRNLTSIEIPSSVTSIDFHAFSGCSSLTSIEIPSSVTYISSGAFSGCDSLTTLTVNVNNTKYKSDGNCIIAKGTNTLIVGCKNSVIPNYVTSIGGYAFSNCISLTNIEIPSSVTSIGYYAFAWCSSLTSIEIPSSVTSIGRYAFAGCNSLTIYCEAESKPSRWDSDWNISDRPVVWGYKG